MAKYRSQHSRLPVEVGVETRERVLGGGGGGKLTEPHFVLAQALGLATALQAGRSATNAAMAMVVFIVQLSGVTECHAGTTGALARSRRARGLRARAPAAVARTTNHRGTGTSTVGSTRVYTVRTVNKLQNAQ